MYEFLMSLAKLLKAEEDQYTSRLHTIIKHINLKGNITQMPKDLRNTLTLLENMVNKVAEAEVQEDADAKAQVKSLQKQITDLQAEAVTDQDIARLDALQAQLEDLLPKAAPEAPVVPPVTEPAVPTPEDAAPAVVEPTEPTTPVVPVVPSEPVAPSVEPSTPVLGEPVGSEVVVPATPGISGEGVLDNTAPLDLPVMDA